MRQVPLLCARAALLALVLLVPVQRAFAAVAEITMLEGKGDKSDGPQRGTWLPAVLGDKLEGGFWVRTQANSQMAVLVYERNNVRLNQSSEMELKTAAEAAGFQQARVKLAKGRAWSQARPRATPAGPGQQPSLAMETPSATLSIRGTDWEVEVAEDGTTQVVVLAGQVDVGNEHGALSVGKGEAARVEPGKAPVKLVLVDPASRVQWVSAWQPQPARWIGAEGAQYSAEIARIEGGDYEAARTALGARAAAEPGAAVLAADLEIHAGNLARAAELLAPHAANGSGDARASALMSRALVRLDKLDEAEQLLDSALVAHAGDAELQIARGELAVLRGEHERAQQAFDAALAAAGSGAGRSSELRAEAWYGIGLIAAEREYVREARRALDQSLASNPDLGKAAAERAAVETFANNLGEAATRYDALLAKEGANYEALTGRGINRLKQGDTEGALQDFLNASVIEPRYARSWLFQGVAFYQQGDRYRAAEAFAHAEEIDQRDPIPHMMESQTEADRLDFGAAIAEAREAQQDMPYLRSLNQLANDQKGSANLGSPIAQFGMEEWAKFYADQAYSPYWGGSHLFLADRYHGKFQKTSELMQGFLTDPLVFGASNRDSTLVPRPGHYGSLKTEYVAQQGTGEAYGELQANGLLQAPTDLAYFLSTHYRDSDSRWDGSSSDGTGVVGGLGWRPRDDLGVFAFVTNNDDDFVIDSVTRPGEAFVDNDGAQEEQRGDIGFNFKLNPYNQFWLKTGGGSHKLRQDGELMSRSTVQKLKDDFSIVNPHTDPRGELDRFDVRVYGNDLQFRQSLDIGDVTVTWGAERSRQEQRFDLVSSFDTQTDIRRNKKFALTDDQEFVIDDEALYLSGRIPWMDVLTLQWDVVYQESSGGLVDVKRVRFGKNNYNAGAPDKIRDNHSTNVNPRLGLRWDLSDTQQIRVVGQRWRRPAAFGTLQQVDTLGIPLDDRLVDIGGKYDRLRVQYNGEFDGRYFVELYGDREVIDNDIAGERSQSLSSAADDLASLRDPAAFFTAPDLIESTPFFPEGSLTTVGIAANVLLTDCQSLAARYIWRDSENRSREPFSAYYEGEIPFIPEHYFSIGSQWTLPGRVLLGADAIYRSERFELNPNYEPAQSGWEMRLRGYWESDDKHHAVQLVLDHLFFEQDAMIHANRDQFLHLAYEYRL